MAAAIASRRGRVVDQGGQLGLEAVDVEVGVGHHHGGAGLGEDAGVGRLVVAGRDRQGHHDRRHPEGGQLGAGAGAGAGHRDVGGGQRHRHAVLVGHQLVDQAPGRQVGRVGGQRGVVPAARHVAHGDVAAVAPPVGQRPDGRRSPGSSRATRWSPARRCGRAGGPARPGPGRAPGARRGRGGPRPRPPGRRRRGLPVTVARGRSVPGNDTAAARLKRDRSRFTAPARTFCSTSTSGTRASTAPKAQAKAA